MNVSNMKY